MTGKVAVVTGGAGGIGKATALCLLDKGHQIALFDLSEERLNSFEKSYRSKYPGRIFVHPVDVSNPGQVRAAIEETEKSAGPVFYLVNAAGVFPETEFTAVSIEEWERVIRINLTGTFLTCQAAAAKMIGRRAGSIVNLSSRLGFCGTAGHSAYSAAKAGVVAAVL